MSTPGTCANSTGAASGAAKPRLVIGEDHQLVLEGIRRVVEQDCEIVGAVNSGTELVALAALLRPDVVLLDIALPLLNGIEAARQIRRADSSVKLIFVTMQLNRDYVREAFEAGASGYVVKQAAASDLVTAIREVCNGRYFLSPAVSERFLEHKPGPNENPAGLFSALTPRQREVLQLVAEGKSAKQIAATLCISVKTVEFHKRHLMEELNLPSTPALIRYAVEHGWVSS